MKDAIGDRLAKGQLSNPANPPERSKVERGRIPMSVPQQKLQVPELPGYHMHWMLGTAVRMAQAQRGGYEFVHQDEIDAAGFGFADSSDVSGSTDLGSRVSVVAGNETENNQAVRLYLMKIREAWWLEDQAALAERNDTVIEAIRGGGDTVANPHDTSGRYGHPENRNILKPNIFGKR